MPTANSAATSPTLLRSAALCARRQRPPADVTVRVLDFLLSQSENPRRTARAPGGATFTCGVPLPSGCVFARPPLLLRGTILGGTALTHARLLLSGEAVSVNVVCGEIQ